MRKSLLLLLKQYNISCPSQVNSLFVSAFVLMNSIEFKNKYLREIVNYSFPQKILLMDGLKNILRVEKNNNFSLETLIQLFEFAISPSNRIVNGAVYTPKNIREFIITSIFKEKGSECLSDKKIVDLSCGCGAFLVDAARSLQKITN